MNGVLKKYWWVLIVAIVAPIILNFVLLCPAITPIVGNNVEWLSFWGGYLGAIISSSISFIILAIQYKQNHNENETNRQLQINILNYQQETQWLNSLRKACADFIISIDTNELKEISYKLQSSKEDVFLYTRIPCDRISKAAVNLAMFSQSNVSGIQKINKATKLFYREYMDLVNDIAILLRNNNLPIFSFKEFIKNSQHVTPYMKRIVEAEDISSLVGDKRIFISNCVVKRIEYVSLLRERANKIFDLLILQQQQRIDKIINPINE